MTKVLVRTQRKTGAQERASFDDGAGVTKNSVGVGGRAA